MAKVILNLSMSLDGFIAGPNDSREQPLGEGGMRLHDWIGDPNSKNLRNNEVLDELFTNTGTMISGWQMYDLVNGWGGSHPINGVPVFVLTNNVPKKVPQGTTPFTFVTDGIESALKQAKAVSEGKNVYVMGGANIAQQYIKAGLFDEIQINLVPVLLGGGVSLFDYLGTGPIELECIRVIDAPSVTHLRFSVVK